MAELGGKAGSCCRAGLGKEGQSWQGSVWRALQTQQLINTSALNTKGLQGAGRFIRDELIVYLKEPARKMGRDEGHGPGMAGKGGMASL